MKTKLLSLAVLSLLMGGLVAAANAEPTTPSDSMPGSQASATDKTDNVSAQPKTVSSTSSVSSTQQSKSSDPQSSESSDSTKGGQSSSYGYGTNNK